MCSICGGGGTTSVYAILISAEWIYLPRTLLLNVNMIRLEATLEECRGSCLSTEGCMCVDWYFGADVCWLQSGTSDTVPPEDIVNNWPASDLYCIHGSPTPTSKCICVMGYDI